MVRLYDPSLELELIYIMPSTPLICSSIGVPTTSAMVAASAPG
nr:hypothetical protein [Duncaniella muris]